MPPTERDGKVFARPATPHRETAVKGEKEIYLCLPLGKSELAECVHARSRVNLDRRKPSE